MKKIKFLSFVKSIVILICFFSHIINGQTQAFPANKVFNYGIMATNKNSQDALDSYNVWKTNFIESCSNGRFRVKFDAPTQTVSEGIAYGMLLSAYAADKTLFDGLWNYYKDNRNGNGVMNWKINGCSGIIGQNGATDAELDAAMALIVADFQWGSVGNINYRADAQLLISAIKNHEIEANTYVLKPGDAFGGSDLTNPSYFAPAYYRAFGIFTNDVIYWNNVANNAYTVINNNLTVNNAVGGLVSDWCKADGNFSNQAGGYFQQGRKYYYDAARTPWRIVTDYSWFGSESARVYAKKCSDFVRVNLGGSANIKAGYNLDGTNIDPWHNATFVGAFACAAMAGQNQNHLNDSYTDLKNLNEPNSYFNHTLKTIYQFLLTGNFYLPNNVLSVDGFENFNDEVSLYPNPNNGVFTIKLGVESKVSIYNIHGEKIIEKEFFDTTNEIEFNQPKGVYILKIDSYKEIKYKKFILN